MTFDKTIKEYYENLGDLNEQEKDLVLRGLMTALANCPVYGSGNFREQWYEWRRKLDYYLQFTTFSNIMQMLMDLRRLSFIKSRLKEMRADLERAKSVKIVIDDVEYSADFLYSALSILDEEDLKCST